MATESSRASGGRGHGTELYIEVHRPLVRPAHLTWVMHRPCMTLRKSLSKLEGLHGPAP